MKQEKTYKERALNRLTDYTQIFKLTFQSIQIVGRTLILKLTKSILMNKS